MPAETLAEQVSGMIWNDYCNRCSSKGFVFNDGSVDPGVTFTEFMKEAHELALQLLSEFPEINLAPEEYLLEDSDTEWSAALPVSRSSRWSVAMVHPEGHVVLQRPYNSEANDLIVARDFPTVDAMQDFIDTEVQNDVLLERARRQHD